MKLALVETDRGVLLCVKAKPNSRCNEVRGVIDGSLKVSVTAVPEKGKANKAIIKLLADALSVSKSQIELTSGGSSSTKKFLVAGIALKQLQASLREYCED